MPTPTFKQLTAAQQMILRELAKQDKRYGGQQGKAVLTLKHHGLITTSYKPAPSAIRVGRWKEWWCCSITPLGRDVLFTAEESTIPSLGS